MGYPLGKAPTKVGEAPAPDVVDVLQGTSALDMQRIIGATYMNWGVLANGGGVVSGTSSMAYSVTAGVAFMFASQQAKLGLLVPFEATTVQTDPAPATGSRTDTVYVDLNGGVRVAIGANNPPAGGSVVLRRFNVAAGITATTAASPSVDRDYAIPVGATLGRLHAFHDPANGNKGNVGAITLGTGRFVIPSDRLVRFDLTHCLSAIQESPTDQPSAAIRWRVYIDDQLELPFTTRVTRAVPQTNFLSFTKALPAGEHKVHYVQDQIEGIAGPGWRHHRGGEDKWPGMRFEVWDAGVAR